MKDKLIIASTLRLADMTDDVKRNLVKQMIGFDLTDTIGKIIGKVIDIQIVNPEEYKIKAEITDEYYQTHIKDGDIKSLQI